MNLSHYFYLYPSYALALTLWFISYRYLGVFKTQNAISNSTITFRKPWLEFIYVILAIGVCILIGQLYISGLLINKIEGIEFITESINHLLIFSPFGLLLLIRKQSLLTVWFPEEGKLRSIFVGFVIAILALLLFFMLKGIPLKDGYASIYSYKNLHLFIQVFAEDFAISMMAVRLISWIGVRYTIIIVATLFAAGHIPAMITEGVELNKFLGLIFDAGLGIMLLGAISKSKNFLWFWMVHGAMDMTQFLN
ncbi:hypothetical protein [Aquimarina sp. Aq78]|uniref:hypothetical protein n=1 Tax=Aquimarina sp. Aq78 TaxID=1191889 RepID=UPI000D0FF438|nr:hypothetical protein [Aquimarina sp. Aq78]